MLNIVKPVKPVEDRLAVNVRRETPCSDDFILR